jgi:hypothetical protein
MRNAYNILDEKVEGKRSLGKPRRRWTDNIETDLKGIGSKDVDRFIWLRIGTSGGLCEHGNESSGSIKGGELLD